MSAASAYSTDAPVALESHTAPPVPPGSVTPLTAALPRRLAHVIVPAAGESFASWIDRFAADNCLSAGQAVLELGLECRAGPGTVRPVLFGTLLTPRSLPRIAAATGLPAARLEAMQLSRYCGTALDLRDLDAADEFTVVTVARREWALFNASRACPRCLAEDEVWQLWWRLGIAAVCPRHRVLLVDSCPQCGIGLRRGAHRHPRGLSRRTAARVGVCGNSLGGRSRCEQHLAEIPTGQVPAALARAQQAALAAAHGAAPPIAGTPVSALDWFAALRYLAAMIRLTATTAQLAGHDGVSANVLDALASEWTTREGRMNGGADTVLRLASLA